MDRSMLCLYREKLARCFTRAQGALGDLCDALLTDLSARSLIDLAQAACFQRRWSSVYAALADGQVDRPALQRLFVESAPRPAAGHRLVLAIDASSIARPEARTAPDRTLVHVPNLPAGRAPVRPGWAFSAVVVVPTPVSSWTHILDNQRIPSTATAVSVAAQQLRDLLPLLPERPIGLLDGGYGTVSWVKATAQLPVDQLVRNIGYSNEDERDGTSRHHRRGAARAAYPGRCCVPAVQARRLVAAEIGGRRGAGARPWPGDRCLGRRDTGGLRAGRDRWAVSGLH